MSWSSGDGMGQSQRYGVENREGARARCASGRLRESSHDNGIHVSAEGRAMHLPCPLALGTKSGCLPHREECMLDPGIPGERAALSQARERKVQG